jgi:NADH-quinone oxidoreductase subunit M
VSRATQTFDISSLQHLATSGRFGFRSKRIFLLLLIGFGILIITFPFHTWAPEAYASAPAPAAMLHAGVLKKFGLYGFIAGCAALGTGGRAALANPADHVLLGTVIYVGLVDDRAEASRLDAWYSSVMHMGYIFLGSHV